jgi:hypothetical protein
VSEEKRRVDFNAPASLVERADSVSDLLDVSRTRLLVEALETKLEDVTDDDAVRERVREAYYQHRIDRGTLTSLLGHEEAARVHRLRVSIARDPPVPPRSDDVPTAEEFYDGSIPEWTPEHDDEDGDDATDEESGDVDVRA